jgi:hypothetical protein
VLVGVAIGCARPERETGDDARDTKKPGWRRSFHGPVS